MNQNEYNKLTKRCVVEQTLDDTGVGLRIRHTSSVAITSVTVITGTNIILIDADGTTTSTFGTDTTVGAVADRINAASNWECKILDSLRSEGSDDFFVNGVITAAVYDGQSYYNALVDTSGANSMAVRLAYSKHTDGVGRPAKASHIVKFKELIYNFTLGGGADTNSLKIYEIDGTTETEIWRSTPTTGSSTTLFSNAMLYGDTGITTMKPGNELVAIITDGTSITGSMHLIGELI